MIKTITLKNVTIATDVASNNIEIRPGTVFSTSLAELIREQFIHSSHNDQVFHHFTIKIHQDTEAVS